MAVNGTPLQVFKGFSTPWTASEWVKSKKINPTNTSDTDFEPQVLGTCWVTGGWVLIQVAQEQARRSHPIGLVFPHLSERRREYTRGEY